MATWSESWWQSQYLCHLSKHGGVPQEPHTALGVKRGDRDIQHMAPAISCSLPSRYSPEDLHKIFVFSLHYFKFSMVFLPFTIKSKHHQGTGRPSHPLSPITMLWPPISTAPQMSSSVPKIPARTLILQASHLTPASSFNSMSLPERPSLKSHPNPAEDGKLMSGVQQGGNRSVLYFRKNHPDRNL